MNYSSLLRRFVAEQITRSWGQALWLLLLVVITGQVVFNQLGTSPVVAGTILLLWLISIGWVIRNDLRHQHNRFTQWLKSNLYGTTANVLITLLLSLLIVAAVRGIWMYAVINASFTTDPQLAVETANGGAVWGAVLDNFRLLHLFRWPKELDWRIWLNLGLLVGLAIASFFVYRPTSKLPRFVRQLLTILWLLSPIMSYLLLRGVTSSGPLVQINPDQIWGGFLLTMILSIFAIVVSFPLGVLLALGRRSKITGIPSWLSYGIAGIIAILGLLLSTPKLLTTARNLFEMALALWPLWLIVATLLFQRTFQGNVVAAFSVIFIEFVRGVPLITVLFMATIMVPLILRTELEILNSWRVLIGFTLFSAAYLAENVRGGLQAIPKGQYEAADALGLSTFNKYRLIILPQALRVVIPAIVGQFIGLFKDTSLVSIVGLFDLLNVANTISAQTDWLGRRAEPYLYVALVYYIGSAGMAAYSRKLERDLGVGQR